MLASVTLGCCREGEFGRCGDLARNFGRRSLAPYIFFNFVIGNMLTETIL
jgi:hypothetical protein